MHPQHLADASRPITIWSFVKTDDIQLVWLEHLTNLFRGRAFAELNIIRSNTNRNGLVRHWSGKTECCSAQACNDKG
ncbi:hypothetical protein OAF65_09220 [Verrucomicrobiales bacterium]|nr:hypothetical protein [Verrucomicrobiales bacterium]